MGEAPGGDCSHAIAGVCRHYIIADCVMVIIRIVYIAVPVYMM